MAWVGGGSRTAAGNLSGFWTRIGKRWQDQLLEKVRGKIEFDTHKIISDT